MLLASEANALARSVHNADADTEEWLDYLEEKINDAASDGFFSEKFEMRGLDLPGFDYRVDRVQHVLRGAGYNCRVYGMEEENIGETPKLVISWLL